jgi:lysophospholipase L1-like esterase
MKRTQGHFPPEAMWFMVPVHIVLSFVLTCLLLNANNTLEYNGRWVSTKTLLAKSVYGAFTYLSSRQSLAKNRLNLGEWNGYQEVLFHDPVNIQKVSFDFYLEKDSYLVFLFNRTEESSDGFRVSAYPLFANAYLHITPKGRFLQKESLDMDLFSVKKWNRFDAEFTEDEVAVYINKERVYQRKLLQSDSPYFGFRSGQNNAVVDNIKVITAAKTIIREDFANRKWMLLIFAVCFVVLDLIFRGILSLPRLKSKEYKQKVFIFVSAEIILIILLTMFFAYDYFYQSLRYPVSKGLLARQEEYWRNIEEEKVLEEIMDRSHLDEPCGEEACSVDFKNSYRILFLGSSQTWGAGAHQFGDVLTRVIMRDLNEDSQERLIECINAGIFGSNSGRMKKLLTERFVDLNPRIVVVNLSNNDDTGKPKEFADNLQAIIDFCKERNIKVLFILEPNSLEHRDELELNAVMREVAQKNAITAIEMNNILKKRYDDGFPWWDNVHMSSFGQEIFAEEVTPELRKMIE